MLIQRHLFQSSWPSAFKSRIERPSITITHSPFGSFALQYLTASPSVVRKAVSYFFVSSLQTAARLSPSASIKLPKRPQQMMGAS